MAVMVGSACIDERGKAIGGAAGNQTGKELRKQQWYLHKKGWYVIRAKDATVRLRIAQQMEIACKDLRIGYDQGQRNTLYKAVEPYMWDIAALDKDVECDCSALVRVCVCYALQMDVANFYTYNEVAALKKTGAFDVLTDDEVCKHSGKLMRGDILVTRTKGHTVVVLDDGDDLETDYAFGERPIYLGCVGDDVKEMQGYLIALGYSCGEWGADGDCGERTMDALDDWCEDNGMPLDNGVAAEDVLEALRVSATTEPAEPKTVVIIGNCNLRMLPCLTGEVISIVGKGAVGTYVESAEDSREVMWHKAYFRCDGEMVTGWVSSKYARLEGAVSYDFDCVDLSSNNAASFDSIDWDALVGKYGFVVLRAGLRNKDGKCVEDVYYARFASACAAHGIPFWAYWYSRGTTYDAVAEEVEMFKTVAVQNGLTPVGYCLDCEQSKIKVETFFELLGDVRKMLYIGHNWYPVYNLRTDGDGFVECCDAVWIPRYGRNDGTHEDKYLPAYPCDLWQYSSVVDVGMPDRTCDASVVTGQRRTVRWFRGEE